KAVRGHIRRYLSALHHSGFDVSAITGLEEMVAFETFKQAMRWFWERNGQKTSCSIGEVAWTMRCIAVKHLACDEEMTASYKEALATLRLRKPGLSPKNRAALQQFDDRAVTGRFLGLPDLLWRLAEKERGKKAQLRIQSAVAIEILIFAPLRIDNLVTLRLDRHLAWIDDRLHINLPAGEVKNRTDLHYVLPRGTTERVRVYIDNWRSLFLPAANPHLFPGCNNKAKDVSCLRRQITRTLFDHTGIRLTPHMFRHVAAKLLLDARPGHYEVVRKVLGHKNLATTYEHYAGAETQAAVELYDNVILDLKHGGDGSAGNDRHRRPEETPRKAPEKDDLPFLDPLNLFGKGHAV
ncbi:MAG: site-specific integrase, partial [Rhodospirillales bacterium]|nr:site-specific integrase [Rhodospirillales bacterium]